MQIRNIRAKMCHLIQITNAKYKLIRDTCPQRHRNRNPSIFASFQFIPDMPHAERKILGFRQNAAEAFALLGRYAAQHPRR